LSITIHLDVKQSFIRMALCARIIDNISGQKPMKQLLALNSARFFGRFGRSPVRMTGPKAIHKTVPILSAARTSRRHKSRLLCYSVLILLVALYLGAVTAHALSATWSPAPVTPGSADWNIPANWVPASVPGNADTATFAVSSTTTITSSTQIFVQALVFNAGASAYSFDFSATNMTINAGFVNNSSHRPTLTFNNGFLQLNSGTAANAAIITGASGIADFENDSTAGTAVISNSGTTEFFNTATAGNATITNNSGGLTKFAGTSTGGGASFINSVGGTVDISQLTSIGMTAGSIEGGGTYALGSKALTVGSNNLNTAVSGTIVDGGIGGGTGGSLIKVGNGTLALSGINTYSGGTTVAGGVLSVNMDAALGNTAAGVTLQGGELLTTADFSSARPVTLNPTGIANTLAAGIGTSVTYTGIISGNGALTVGDGTNTGTVFLASGSNTYMGGTTVQGNATLTVNSDNDLGNPGGNITLNGGKLVTIDFITGRTVTLLGQGTLAARNTVLNWSAAFNGQITGTGALTVGDANSSTLTVALTNPSNNYTGGTTVTGGATLRINTDSELGASSALTLDGGNLQTTADGFTSSRDIILISNPVANTLSPLLSNTTATYTGLISGSGSLTAGGLGGGGTVVLTGLNTYTGGTTIRNGVLSVATDGNLGNAIGGITLEQGTLLTTVNGFTSSRSILLLTGEGNDTLAALSGTTATYNGPISGDGALFVGSFDGRAGTPNSGTVVFTNHTNSYTAGTTITNGATLSVDSDTELGASSGRLTLQDGEFLSTGNGFATTRTIQLLTGTDTLAAATGTTATYTGVIRGNAPLVVGDFVNEGTVVLGGVNTFSGGTQIRGTLVAASDNALGTGEADLFRGTLMIQAGVTIGNPVVFMEGGLVDNAGTLNNNITDTFSVAEVVLNSGTINGSVTLGGATNRVVNSGTINGDVTLNGGSDTVQLFTGSKITGRVDLGAATNSALILDGAGQELLSQAVIGTLIDHGTLTKQGIGTWTIDRALSAPLGTDILAGTLVVEAALTTAHVNIARGAILQLNAGGSVGNLVDDGSVVFASSGTFTFDSIISGTGNVIQAGAGTTILSSRNTYSGGTIINLGTLLVNNPQALGTGNVIVNGGVLAADPQPINVLGNYTQNAGGTLQLNIAGRAPGQFDVLNVMGTASLNGNLRLLNLGYLPQNGDKLRLINAGGVVSGRFSTFQNPFAVAAGFDTIDLVYARNSVTLEFLKLNRPVTPTPPGPPIIIMSTDYASFALSFNQLAVGNALNRLQLTLNDPRLVDFLASEPFANLPGDLEKISPDSLTALYEISFSAANVQASNLEDRFAEIRNGSSGFSSTLNLKNSPRAIVEGKDGKAMLEPDQGVMTPGSGNRWGVWISGSGDYVDVSSDGNGKGFDFTTGGVTLGLDYRLTQNLAVGVALGYAHTWSNLNGGGDLSANSGRAGLYATYYQSGFFVNGYVGGGYNSYDTKRATLGGVASGNPDSGEFDGYLGGGYEFHRGGFTFGPIAALQYTYLGINGNTESGSLAPLQISSQHADSLRTNLGLKASYAARVGTIEVTPSVSASWQHEFLYSALPITAQFTGSGNRFTVTGPEEGQDSALINAGVNLQWTPKIGTYIGYNGQLGRSRYDSQGGVCSVHLDF
jgi:fibronectin-binding autotransporter adhesin